jgi:ubiquinone biosynthesis protein UbiJ
MDDAAAVAAADAVQVVIEGCRERIALVQHDIDEYTAESMTARATIESNTSEISSMQDEIDTIEAALELLTRLHGT